MSEEYREDDETATDEAEGAGGIEEEPVETPPSPPPRDPTQDEDPTYRVESWSGLSRYVCLICEHEDWSLETLSQHMDVYHRGILREAPSEPADDPASETLAASEEPAGQTPETPETDVEEAPATEGV